MRYFLYLTLDGNSLKEQAQTIRREQGYTRNYDENIPILPWKSSGVFLFTLQYIEEEEVKDLHVTVFYLA